MDLDELLALYPAETRSGTVLLQTLTAVTRSAVIITHGYASTEEDEVRWMTRIALLETGEVLHRDEWAGPHLAPENALIGAGESPEKEAFLAIQGAPYVTLTTLSTVLDGGSVVNRRHIRVPRRVRALNVAGQTFRVTSIGHVLLGGETPADEASTPAPLAAIWDSGESETWGSLPQAPRTVRIPGFDRQSGTSPPR